MAKNDIVLFGMGDVGPIHEPMSRYSELVRDTLETGDIRFAQAELIFSSLGKLQVHAAGEHGRGRPEFASVFSDCKIDVASVASNHALTFGVEAFFDSMESLRSRGVTPVGGGRNRDEACRPVYVERDSIRVAFLAYCSVLPEGYAAGKDRPGAAPLRAHTYYEPYESQPGMPPRIVTIPFEEDLNILLDNVREAKRNAHCVVVSFHWGIHHIPRMIADYQHIATKMVFEAGGDLILGHHAHMPKGIGVHGGKVCFYSLSNFIMTVHERTPERSATFLRRYAPFGATLDPDPAYRHLPHGSDGKRSMIAKAILSKEGVRRVSFLPVLIDRQLRPEILRNGDPRFDEMVQYMDWASEELNHKFSVEGDEVVVLG